MLFLTVSQSIHSGKEEIKLSLLIIDIVNYLESLRKSTENLLINEFSLQDLNQRKHKCISVITMNKQMEDKIKTVSFVMK